MLIALVEFVEFWGAEGHATQKAEVVISCKAGMADLLDDATVFSSVLDKSFAEHTMEVKLIDK